MQKNKLLAKANPEHAKGEIEDGTWFHDLDFRKPSSWDPLIYAAASNPWTKSGGFYIGLINFTCFYSFIDQKSIEHDQNIY